MWICISVFLTTSYFSTGYNQSDEHFQILEFAGLKLGFNKESDLAWEYHERMRPALQPSIAVLIHKASTLIGIDNPFTIAWILRLLSAFFSLTVSWFLYKVYAPNFKSAHQLWAFFLFSFYLWFSFYNGVRFNSETWSAHTFALVIALFMYWKQPDYRQYFLLGLLAGVSFLFRYQVAAMIAGLGLWLFFIHGEQIKRILSFALGGFIMIGIGILIDHWFYGEWVISLWHYFEQNILLDKASSFGVDPWWHYFSLTFIKGIPPFGMIFILAILLFLWLKPKDLISWITIPFLGMHLIIAHKELRFLYVLLPFLPIAMSTVLQWWENRQTTALWSIRTYRLGWRIFWGQNALLTVFIMFWPIIMEMNIYKFIYNRYHAPIALYGINDNPYRAALDIKYYKRQNLYTSEVENLSTLPHSGRNKYLLAIDRRYKYPLDSIPGEKKLIFSSYPEWINQFNYNDWLGRTNWWMIYEITPEINPHQ